MRPLLLLLLAACPRPVSDDTPLPDDTDGKPDTDDTDTEDTDDTGETDDSDTGETGDTAPPAPPWNGAGPYRVVLVVPGYDPGPDGYDEGPAGLSLDLSVFADLLGATGTPDPSTLQVVREDADGQPLAPPRQAPDARGAWDEAEGGTVVPLETQDSWSWEGTAPLPFSWPAWTPYPTAGSLGDGVLTLKAGQSAYLGTLFSVDGGFGWDASGGVEVAIDLKVVSLDSDQQDVVALAVSDGSHNVHLRWRPDGLAFYGMPETLAMDTADWHTYRIALSGDTAKVCVDDDPTQVVETTSAFTYARNALWLGDDGSGTGGTVQIERIAWTFAGDGDPCTP